MKVIWIFLIIAISQLEYNKILGTPLTKWFKTDNNTYYIEEEIKFTILKSYQECEKKDMNLITQKSFKEDKLLLQYLQENYNPQPTIWLNNHENVNLVKISELIRQFPKIIEEPNNQDKCSTDDTNENCEDVRGFICHKNNSQYENDWYVQNIELDLN